MNEQIKSKIKKAIGDQIIEKNYFCINCNREETVIINIKLDKVTCKKCNLDYSIDDKSYDLLYKSFNKMGIY